MSEIEKLIGSESPLEIGQKINEMIEKGVGSSGFNLFDTKISDHILEGEEAIGWMLQGSYVNGAVYPDFYAKCLEEFNEATTTETVNDVTLKTHSNGHKFYDIIDKTGIDAFFNTMGSAWFYGIDTENERIFLPRDKYFAINGEVSIVGNGKALGLTDGTNTGYAFQNSGKANNLWNAQPAFFASNQGTIGSSTSAGNEAVPFASGRYLGISTDPLKSGIKGQLITNEEKYLYFCVGNAVVNKNLIDIGKISSELQYKADIDLSNCSRPYVIDTYKNGTSWYRIWSDGWCEQGGVTPYKTSPVTITLLKEYADTNYNVILTDISHIQNYCVGWLSITRNTKTVSTFQASGFYGNGTLTGVKDNSSVGWTTTGYIE